MSESATSSFRRGRCEWIVQIALQDEGSRNAYWPDSDDQGLGPWYRYGGHRRTRFAITLSIYIRPFSNCATASIFFAQLYRGEMAAVNRYTCKLQAKATHAGKEVSSTKE